MEKCIAEWEAREWCMKKGYFIHVDPRGDCRQGETEQRPKGGDDTNHVVTC